MGAREEFFGWATGLSASVITGLSTEWQREGEEFAHGSLKDVDYVYVHADGMHFNVRLEEVAYVRGTVGVRTDGTKELVGSETDIESDGVVGGHTTRTEATRYDAAVLAVGDRALGFGAPLEVSRHAAPAMLGPQDGQRHQRPKWAQPPLGSHWSRDTRYEGGHHDSDLPRGPGPSEWWPGLHLEPLRSSKVKCHTSGISGPSGTTPFCPGDMAHTGELGRFTRCSQDQIQAVISPARKCLRLPR